MLGLSDKNSCLGVSEYVALQRCLLEPHKIFECALKTTVSEACLHATIENLRYFVFSLLQIQSRSPACLKIVRPGLHVEVRESYSEKWGKEASSAFENVLLKLLVKSGLSDATHEGILNALMELVLSELPRKFNNVLYWKLCMTLVESEVSITNIIKALASQYLQYEDVRYFTAKNVHKLAMQHLYANFTAKETQEDTDILRRKSGAAHNLLELACGLIPVLQCCGVDLVEEASYSKFCQSNIQPSACVVGMDKEWTQAKALPGLEQKVKCYKKDANERLNMSLRSEQIFGMEEEEELSETDCSKARIEVFPFESMEKIESGVIDSNWFLSAARGKDEENHTSTKDESFVSGGKDKRKSEEEDDAEDDESDDYEDGGGSDDNDGNDDGEGEEEGNEDDDNEGDEDDEDDEDEYDEEVAAQFAQQSKAVANVEDDDEDEENGHGEGDEGIEGEESEGEDEDEGVEEEFEEEDGAAEEDEEDEDEDEEEEAAQPPKKKSKGA